MKTQILSTQKNDNYATLAGELLRRGELVVIPTETVYGLAANALDENAVKKIYEAKGRPSDNPLIVHIAEFAELAPLVREVPETAKRLADAFWPGPLTMILPKSEIVPQQTSGGLPTVAVRMPSHPAARAVIRASGVPLAAPSANISGFPSPSKAEHAIDDMNGRVPLILDGGDCEVGVESTVITLATAPPTVLRPGGITPEQIAAVIGEVRVDQAVLQPLEQDAKVASPGMKYKHYAPNTQISVYCGSRKGYLRFLEKNRARGIFALCYADTARQCATPAVVMGDRTEPLSQTRRLFDALRELDERGAVEAIAECPEKNGIGLAVCNRLFRAAAFRMIREAPVIGLTGQTGAGKSTVAEILCNLGFAVVDCDRIAREITAKGSPTLDRLRETFGAEITDADGNLNRHALALRAFASADQTAKLNAITHPIIVEKARDAALSYSAKNIPCVLDAPLLFQCGLDEICDATLAVTADADAREQRLLARDGISPQEIRKRMAAQEPESYYIEKADIIVKNSSMNRLRADTEAAARRILAAYEYG